LFVAETFVDHLTVTAPTLAAGAAFVNQVLGVAPQPGGEHPRMGTHNLLVRLGESLFLEVIAPNPNAAAPYRPRWFGLDCMRADALPSLSTWVVRTGDIHASVTACSEALGEIEPMSRGAINWLITIPADGSVPVDGVAPALIEWHTPAMSGNTIGTLFAVTSFGESHGPAIGCVVDGCPPGLALSAADIQAELDRRKPGTSRHVTQRREAGYVEILSGVFEGRTTGTPIALLIRNQDQRSKDYGNIAETFRPGHADYAYTQKYGFRDHRGGGRSSARETAVRVAAGAIARKWLK
jgi:hypothetical protein